MSRENKYSESTEDSCSSSDSESATSSSGKQSDSENESVHEKQSYKRSDRSESRSRSPSVSPQVRSLVASSNASSPVINKSPLPSQSDDEPESMKSPGSAPQTQSPSPIQSPDQSHSVSPRAAHSRSPSAGSVSVRSERSHASSASPKHSSPSPAGSDVSQSSCHRSSSPSQKSRSGTPARSRSASENSGSGKSSRSGSLSGCEVFLAKSTKRATLSKSRNLTAPPSARFGSAESSSPKSAAVSRSPSPRRFASPGSIKSGASERSRSVSDERSKTGSYEQSRSRSDSPESVKSAKSGSPSSKKSESLMSRISKLRSPASSDSDSDAGGRRKPVRSAFGSDEFDSDQSMSHRKRIIQSDDEGKSECDESSMTVTKLKKKKILRESDGEGEKLARNGSDEESGDDKAANVDDLFGDADDISSEEEGGQSKTKRKQEINHIDEGHKDKDLNIVDRKENEKPDEEEEEQIPERRIDVEIPKITFDTGRDIHFMKMPNFLSVETRPFEPDTYEDEIDDEETLDEEGRARLKLKVENTIRWRYGFDKDQNVVKESNARFVKWSDGSMTLHVGSEIFDVYKQPFVGDHNHMFVRQGTGLQGQAVFRTKLSFRPHSTESFTHKKMTLSLADRSQKTTGIKVLSQVGVDPEHDREEKIKREEEKLRASMRRESKQKRLKEKGSNRSITSNYLEPDREDASDDENAISLSAIKSRYKKNQGNETRRNIYSSDDDDSDFETGRKKTNNKVKVIQESDSDEKSGSVASRSGSAVKSSSEDDQSKKDSDSESERSKAASVISNSDND